MLPRKPKPRRPRRHMFVAFAMAGERWCLPAERVAGVGELRAVTPLPAVDRYRRPGVIVHQGKVVALVTLEGLADGAAPPEAQPSHYLLLRAEPEPVAVAVDALVGLEASPDGSPPEGLRPLPAEALATLPGNGEATP